MADPEREVLAQCQQGVICMQVGAIRGLNRRSLRYRTAHGLTLFVVILQAGCSPLQVSRSAGAAVSFGAA